MSISFLEKCVLIVQDEKYGLKVGKVGHCHTFVTEKKVKYASETPMAVGFASPETLSKFSFRSMFCVHCLIR